MRILCAIGLRAGPEIIGRLVARTASPPELVLLHVIDEGPRRDMQQFSGPLRRGPRGGPPRFGEMDAAEEAAGRDALEETRAATERLGLRATPRIERGKPEQIIVAVAREVQADLVVVRARDHAERHPFLGPGSVGHVARFVLDHAPCDVLLLRPASAAPASPPPPPPAREVL